MHEQLLVSNHMPSEVEELEPESRSSWTDNGSGALANNEGALRSLPFLNHSPIMSNHQLHELVSSPERVYCPEFRAYLPKYLSMVIYFNNTANQLIRKLERRACTSKRGGAVSNNGGAVSNNGGAVSNNGGASNRLSSNLNCSAGDSDSSAEQMHLPLASPSSERIEYEIGSLLGESERILEYAASCGKNIDRKLIICVLVNQACFYQKMWALERACTYIEATILNMEQWGYESNWSDISSSLLHNPDSCSLLIPYSPEEDPRPRIPHFKHVSTADPPDLPTSNTIEPKPHDETERLAKNYELVIYSHIHNPKTSPYQDYGAQLPSSSNNASTSNLTNKELSHHVVKLFELSIYYLQYCSLCGQMTCHDKAIEAAKRVIGKLRKINRINRKLYHNLASPSGEEDKSEAFGLALNPAYQHSKRNSLNSSRSEIPRVESIVNLTIQKMVYGLSELEENFSGDVDEARVEKYRETARYYLRQLEKITIKCSEEEKKASRLNQLLLLHKKITMVNDSNTNWEQPPARKQVRLGSKIALGNPHHSTPAEDTKTAEKLKQELKQFSISDILQIKSREYKFVKSEQQSQLSEGRRYAGEEGRRYAGEEGRRYAGEEGQREWGEGVKPDSFNNSMELVQSLLMNVSCSTFSFQFLFSNAILVATSYFILATELRLQAAKEESSEGERFKNRSYRESEVYHLTAIIILAVYVPGDMTYLKHMVSSYQNYYIKQINPIDEMTSNDYGNGPSPRLLRQHRDHNHIMHREFDSQGVWIYPGANEAGKDPSPDIIVSLHDRSHLKAVPKLTAIVMSSSVGPNQDEYAKNKKQGKHKSRVCSECGSLRNVKKCCGKDSHKSSLSKDKERAGRLSKHKKPHSKRTLSIHAKREVLSVERSEINKSKIEREGREEHGSVKSRSLKISMHSQTNKKYEGILNSPRNGAYQMASKSKSKSSKTIKSCSEAAKKNSQCPAAKRDEMMAVNCIKGLPSKSIEYVKSSTNSKNLDPEKEKRDKACSLLFNNHQINSISRSTNMISKEASRQKAYAQSKKNSWMEANNVRRQEPVEKSQVGAQKQRDKKRKRVRKSSKELKLQYKKISEYKLNGQHSQSNGTHPVSKQKTPNKIHSKSKSKSKTKSKNKDYQPQAHKKSKMQTLPASTQYLPSPHYPASSYERQILGNEASRGNSEMQSHWDEHEQRLLMSFKESEAPNHKNKLVRFKTSNDIDLKGSGSSESEAKKEWSMEDWLKRNTVDLDAKESEESHSGNEGAEPMHTNERKDEKQTRKQGERGKKAIKASNKKVGNNPKVGKKPPQFRSPRAKEKQSPRTSSVNSSVGAQLLGTQLLFQPSRNIIKKPAAFH